MAKALEFKLVLKETPVVIENAEGHKANYILKEMIGEQRDRFLTGMNKRVVPVQGTKERTKIANFDGIQSSLIAKCLFDEEKNLVPEKTIQGYPSTVITGLFKEAQRLNDLGDDEVMDKFKEFCEKKDATVTEMLSQIMEDEGVDVEGKND